MKYLNFKLLILFAALALAIPPAWAETVTLTLTDFPSLTSSYTSGSITKGGITYSYTDFIKNSPDIQVRKTTGEIHNVTPYSGDITSVTITHSGTANPTTILGSSDGSNWSQVTTGSGSITGNFSNKGYKYFKITRGSGAAYWTKIEITYETGGDPTPGKTDVELAFSSATATATLGQSFTAPTLSVDPAAASGAVTYSSSNTSVATVNASTGAVTPVAAGTTTITASISNNATYNDASASYELTVEAGSQPGGVEYELLTNLNQLQNGKKVIIANSKASGSQKAMGPQQNNNFSETDVTITSGLTITAPSTDVQILTLEGTTGAWYFKTSDNEYLYAASSTKNYLKTEVTPDNDNNAKAAIVLGSDGNSVITFQGTNTRNLLRYNSSDKLFSCYASGQQPVYLYVESGGSATERVATPTFSPEGGSYDAPQSVTISCETPNSTIYYTTDGSTPDENSTLYTGAINVSETTTIKAIAVATGMDNSYVASATYNIRATVDNFADANGLDDNTNFKYTKDVVVVYRKNAQMWIQDKDGTEGGGFVFTEGLTFSKNDVINANWTAKKIKYSTNNTEYPEFTEFVGTASSTTQTPVAIERSALSTDNIHEYVLLKNVTISDELYVTLGSRAQYQLYTAKLGECVNFTPETGKTYDVKGLVGVYQNTLQIYPLEITEYVAPGNPSIMITSPETLPFNDEGGVYTVNATFLPDGGLGVSVSDGFSRYLINGDNTYYYFDAPNVAETGHTVTGGQTRVEYTGRELSATGTITYASSPVSETAELSYRADIYIVGNINNAGWNFGDGSRPMSYDEATGLYTAQLTTTDHSYFMFARKPGQNYGWQGDQNRLFFGAQTDGGNWVLGTEPTGNIDVYGTTGNQYHPIELPSAGEYTITVNPNPTAKTFTITKVVHQVETPVISPESGNYNTIQTVTITCATEGADIHYTTDGSTPTESSTLYEGPITVDQSMTIKAIAVMDGMDNSEVAEATYTLPTSVKTLAAANELEENTEFLFTGDAVVTYHNGDYTFLRDVNATAGGGLIYQSGINLAQGVVLKKGWDAKRDDYRGEKEYINAINVESSGSTADYTPFNRTGVVFDDTHMNEYVTFNNVTITGKTLDEGSGKYTYTGTYSDDNRVTVNYTLHNQFDLNNIEEGRTYNVTGVVVKRDENMQVYPTAVTLVQQNPNLAFAEQNVNATFGADFNEPALTKPEGVTVTYSSSDPTVAEVDATTGEVTIKKVGNATIIATSAENQYYTSGTASYNIVVTAGTPTFAYSESTASAVFGKTATLPTLNNPNGLTVTYTSSNPAVATVNAQGEVAIVGAGTTVITATGDATGNYNGAEAQYTLTVTKAQATLSFAEEVINATYGGEAPANALTNDANLAVTYSIEPEGVATIDPATGKLTIVGVGTATVTATGEANANYEGATATYTLKVTKAQATLSFAEEVINATYGGEAPANALTNDANLAVTYSIDPEGVATIDPATGKLTIVGVGTATVTATGEANANYNGATASYTLTVSKAQATLAFAEEGINATYGGEAPANALTNEAGLAVTYSIDPEGVATIDPATGKLTIVGVGTATVTATGEANANYEGATATYTLTVTKAQATLTFAKGTINATIGGEVEANPLTNEANLTVAYSSSDTNVATVDATTGKVNIVGTGSAIITATGEENANYLGTTATYTINVAAADAITFTLNTDVMNYNVGDKVKVKVDDVQNAIGDYTITYKIGDTELVPDENGYVTIPTAEVGEVTLTVTVKDAYEHSTEATQNFVFNIAAADAITFTLTPDGGEYTVGDKVNVKVSNIQNTIGDYTITYTTNFTREPQTYDPEQGIDITSDEAGQVNLTVTVTDAYEHAAEGTKSAVYKFAAAPAIEITLNPDGGEYIVGDVVNVTVAVDKTLGDYTVVYQIDGGEAQNYDAATGIVITRSTVGNVDLKVTVTDGYEHEDDGTASATYVFKPVPVVAAPTFSLASGTYDTPQDVTITGPEGATIYYSVDGGLTWTEGNSQNMTETTILMAKAVKDGIESPVVTNAYVIKQTVERIPVEPIDGYFSIKNNGNNMFANVQGRKTLTFCDDAAKEAQAGTVIYVKTDKYGQVQSLRSQAADLQGYADRAMRYVPEVVQLVVDKLHATGVGSLLGEDGYDAIKEKFNESFDYHLYVEKDGENYRIYGKTPSMQPVVDFYAENMSRVDEKLPMLEDFINDAIDKVLNKTNGHGASILVDYDLEEVWQRMGGNLTKPEDEASTMAFYRQVLCNKDNVWNFAYQSVMIYWERLKNHDLYEQMKEDLGEFANYVDKLEQVLPDMKYYIVADGNKVDYISAGNGDIINGAARTYWTLVPRTTFTKNFDENNYFGCILNKKYVATLYTDFAYTLPEDVKAYKVTRVSVNGLATLEALSGAIPAQTPVLLMSEEAGDKVLNLSATGTADMAKNLLVGPDYLIDEYKLVTPQVQGLFNFVKQYVSEEFYNTYVTPYEHLMYKNSGTVGNKYFWGLPSSDLDLCVYTNAENSSDCVVRSLGVNEATGTFGFVDHWSVRTNEAFLVSSEVDEIRLSNRGDVNHDGVVDINDVTLTISRVLGIDTPDCCPYCADVVETGVVDIDDVTELINIVLGVR